MGLFKNKNKAKIVELKNANVKLSGDPEYVIAVVKKYGLLQLKDADPKLMNDSTFWLKLIREVPDAIICIPDELDKKDGKNTTDGTTLALLAYLSCDSLKVYEYMKPEQALRVREFESSDCPIHAFYVKNKLYKFAPTWDDRIYIGQNQNPQTLEELSVKKDRYLQKLDDLRPDVKKLVENKQANSSGEDESGS